MESADWVILFNDPDIGPEVFTDEKCARARLSDLLHNWDCDLYAKVTQATPEEDLGTAPPKRSGTIKVTLTRGGSGKPLECGEGDEPEGREGATWELIETAPTNTSVLVFIPNWDHYGPAIYRAILVDMGTGKRWHGTAWAVGRDLGGDAQPTHWMPLPQPPSAEARKGGK